MSYHEIVQRYAIGLKRLKFNVIAKNKYCIDEILQTKKQFL